MTLINTIRNIIAFIFLGIGRLFAVQSKKETKKVRKPTGAIDFKPTSDFKEFLEQLSKKDIKGGPAINNVFAITTEVKDPLCYDLRVHTTFTDKYEVFVEQRILSKGSNGWRVIAAIENTDVLIHGIVDDLILGAAARGWNCTEPVNAIVTSFVDTVFKTQRENRLNSDGVGRDIVHVQFFMPHAKQSVKMTVRVYDPTSAISETNSPHITIPFFRASQKSKKSATS